MEGDAEKNRQNRDVRKDSKSAGTPSLFFYARELDNKRPTA